MRRGIVFVLVMVILSSNVIFGEEQIWLETKVTMTSGEILKELGLIKGDENGNLNEDQLITRVEMITLLNRLKTPLNNQNYDIKNVQRFSDVPVSHWAFEEVEKAYLDAVTQGIGDGLFGTNDTVTNQQTYTFLLRIIGEGTEYRSAARKFDELGLSGSLYVGPHSNNIERGMLFKLIVNCLQYNNEGKTYIENLSFSSEAKELFNKRVEETTLVDAPAFYTFPKVQMLEFDNVNVYEGSEGFVIARERYQAKVLEYYSMFYGVEDYKRIDFEEVGNIFKSNGDITLSTKNACFYDDNVSDEDKSIVIFSSDYYLAKEGYVSSNTESGMGSNGSFYKDANYFVGEPLNHNNQLLTPMIVVAGDDKARQFMLLLMDDDGFVEGMVLSNIGGIIYGTKTTHVINQTQY